MQCASMLSICFTVLPQEFDQNYGLCIGGVANGPSIGIELELQGPANEGPKGVLQHGVAHVPKWEAWGPLGLVAAGGGSQNSWDLRTDGTPVPRS